jgi:hypothetical protein
LLHGVNSLAGAAPSAGVDPLLDPRAARFQRFARSRPASEPRQNSLPEGIKAYLVHTSDDTNVINIQRWVIEDLNVTSYPEARVYKKIGKPETGYRCWQR